jgi:hypothetical protein
MQLQKIFVNNQPSISDVPKKYGNTQLLHPMLLPVWDLRVSVQLPALSIHSVDQLFKHSYHQAVCSNKEAFS